MKSDERAQVLTGHGLTCGSTPSLTPRSYLTVCSECGGGRWVESVPATIEMRRA